MEEPPGPGPGRRDLGRSVRLKSSYLVQRGRAVAAERAFHTIRGGRRRELLLPYPPAATNEPRYGHGRPSHQRLAALLARRDEDYRAVLEGFREYEQALRAIPSDSVSPREPHWRNTLLFGLDGISLYAFTRQRRPRRYIEVGSGNSTLFVDRARRDGSLEMEIVSIDPHPRREIDEESATA